MTDEIEGIERATLDAVAPLKVLSHGHWLIPLDQTTIGRATSAVPLRHRELAVADLSTVEDVFASHQKKAQFRIADVPALSNIHQALTTRGYIARQPTHTQTVGLHMLARPEKDSTDCTFHFSETPTDAWRSIYLNRDFDPVDSTNRVLALSRSSFAHYAWMETNDGVVAAGTMSMSHQWVGFHGIRTLNKVRGQGIAGKLMAKMAEVGIKRGFSKAFLQVDEENSSAINLYRRLGFETQWRYHYWTKNSTTGSTLTHLITSGRHAS